MNEEVATARWFKTRLGNDDDLSSLVSGVFADMIPLDKQLPAIRFSVQFRSDTIVVNGRRVLTILDYLVVGINEGPSLVPLVAIADRIDVLLDRASGQTDDLIVLACVRSEPHTSVEYVEGRQFRAAGGIYRTTVQQLGGE